VYLVGEKEKRFWGRKSAEDLKAASGLPGGTKKGGLKRGILGEGRKKHRAISQEKL